ncbi:hypothetical protein [Vitiosangium sp. GDMCC 1.1324]|uniref:hypothetical protein n=1 Tax=Vitiosangium sp. (strain GDMCC 1.1324) TaxID=2138576 RepID=UPI000D35430B|nr:hypothetical protein [Vitiosangium sp. GDMCC 1.1324]PTL82223.1 hypothetical protein DAT35_20760 [Vitiosangium sp. GDMCC 1.1324]
MSTSRSPSFRLAAGRNPRGAALVETVLLMLVLIPLLLYALFLIDAAYMKLDLQETVVAGIWDMSTRNAESGSANAEMDVIQHAVRATYSDHTSAVDDGAEVGGPGYGDVERIRGNHNHQKHHKIYFAAQYTFRFDANVGPDTQFQCEAWSDSGLVGDPVVSSFEGSSYNAGGRARCWAKGYIYNYIIPEKLFTEFTDVKMSNLTKRGAGSDSHQYQGTGGNIVAYERGAVYFNTWALRTGSSSGRLNDADIGARSSALASPGNVAGPFYDRVVQDYSQVPTYGAVAGASGNFTARAQSALYMNAVTANATTREAAGLPNMAGTFLVARYKAQSPGQKQAAGGVTLGGGQKYLSTPYSGINNNYQSAASRRGVHYMGCRQAEQDKCP